MRQIGLMRWRVRLFMLAVSVATVLAIVMMQQPTSAAERARAWTSSHGPVAISSLSDLAAYPTGYRGAIFNSLPSRVKSNLWREKIGRLLASDNQWSDAQRAYLSRVMEKVTPEAFENTSSFEGVCQEARGVLTNLKVLKVAHLADGVEPSYSLSSLLAVFTERIALSTASLKRSTVAEAGAWPACNCYDNGWCECNWYGEQCRNNNEGIWYCNPNETECGCVVEVNTCNGKCCDPCEG
jgi:hypothetical protein